MQKTALKDGLFPLKDLVQGGLRRGDYSGYLSDKGAQLLGLPWENGEIWEQAGTDSAGNPLFVCDYRRTKKYSHDGPSVYGVKKDIFNITKEQAKAERIGFIRYTENFDANLLRFIAEAPFSE